MTHLKRKTPPSDTSLVPDELARELQQQRELAAARREDELARVRAEAGHGRARADVAEESRRAALARAEREDQARADAELARMYREFRAAGERIRIRSLMAGSGEARALRLDRLRSRNLVILVPLLLGFGVWSTTGVQQGAARLMAVSQGSPVWWVLWGLEALLIGLVCWIIVARARLSVSGGELAVSAERIGVGCLTTSIFLNLVAAVPTGTGSHVSGWAVPGAMFAHAIGPVGAAVTAHLIGLIDTSISDADPWHDKDGQDVPRLAEMDLNLPTGVTAAPALETEAVADGQGDAETAAPVAPWPVRVGERSVLPLVALPQPEPHVPDSGQVTPDERAAVERLEYTGPAAQEAEPETSAPWRQEPPTVREAIARVLGEDLVRGAEQYLTEHAENPGTLRELPPPADQPEHPTNAPDKRPDQRPDERPEPRPDEPGQHRPEAAHDSVSEPSGSAASERCEHGPHEQRQAIDPADPRARLAAVRRLLEREPDLNGGQIAARLGLPPSTARRLAKQIREEQSGRDERGGGRR